MKLAGSTALVTGSNRGIGAQFATERLRRGGQGVRHGPTARARRYPGREVLRLDILDPVSVRSAAEIAGDVDILINNAADTAGGNLVTGDLEAVRRVMESNYFGTLNVIRAFAPVLARNGGGAIVNVLSAAAWLTVDGNTAYAAAKSAEWGGLTNGVRVELAGQGTQVVGLMPGLIGTETLLDFARSAGIEFPRRRGHRTGRPRRAGPRWAGSRRYRDRRRDRAAGQATLSGPPQAFAL